MPRLNLLVLRARNVEALAAFYAPACAADCRDGQKAGRGTYPQD